MKAHANKMAGWDQDAKEFQTKHFTEMEYTNMDQLSASIPATNNRQIFCFTKTCLKRTVNMKKQYRKDFEVALF